jgi:hypothetical protein
MPSIAARRRPKTRRASVWPRIASELMVVARPHGGAPYAIPFPASEPWRAWRRRSATTKKGGCINLRGATEAKNASQLMSTVRLPLGFLMSWVQDVKRPMKFRYRGHLVLPYDEAQNNEQWKERGYIDILPNIEMEFPLPVCPARTGPCPFDESKFMFWICRGVGPKNLKINIRMVVWKIRNHSSIFIVIRLHLCR